MLGTEHPDYANSLIGHAVLYEKMGDYARAEPLYLEAKKVYAKVLGTKHPDYANTLNNLAGLYEKTGDDTRAQSLHLELKRIRRKALSKEDK